MPIEDGRPRIPREERWKVAARLPEGRAGKPRRIVLAEAHGVTERTVRNWQRSAKDPPRRPGRPGTDPAIRSKALEEVKVQRKLQGESAGWRPIAKALSGKHPTRLVQHTLSALKKTDRIEKRKRLAALAEKVTVLAKEVIFAQDQMHLGRQDGFAVVTDAPGLGRQGGGLLGVRFGRAVDQRDRHHPLIDKGLLRQLRSIGPEHDAQRVMPGRKVLDRQGEEAMINRAIDLDGGADVVQGDIRVQHLVEPDLALRGGQGK